MVFFLKMTKFIFSPAVPFTLRLCQVKGRCRIGGRLAGKSAEDGDVFEPNGRPVTCLGIQGGSCRGSPGQHSTAFHRAHGGISRQPLSAAKRKEAHYKL